MPGPDGGVPAEAGATMREIGMPSPPSQQTLHELASTLSGVSPESQEGRHLASQLAALGSYPGVYEIVTREVLAGLVQAQKHQEQALADLTAQQRDALLSSDPAGPLSPKAAEALSRLDRGHLMEAQAALQRTAARVTAALEAPAPAPDSLQRGIAEELGRDADAPWAMGAQVSPSTPEAVAASILSLPGMTGLDADALAHQLGEAPPQALGALYIILEAANAFPATAHPEQDLLALAGAIDAAEETLRLWAAASLARDLSATPLPTLPDPANPVPDLDFALPAAARGDPSPVTADLMVSLQRLAELLGADATDQEIERQSSELQAHLDAEQEEALANLLGALADHHEARLNALPVNASALRAWADALARGELPPVGTPEGDALLHAMPAMESQYRALDALGDVLHAVEEAVSAFAPPSTWSQQSSSGSPEESGDDSSVPLGYPGPDDVPDAPVQMPEAPCENPEADFFGILILDLCGEDNIWTQEAAVVIDVGGDDLHAHRAGAPFTIENPALSSVSFNVLLDLDGNDTYDSNGQDCAQGAVCENGTLSIVVDWAGDGTDQYNRFTAGNQSQGYAFDKSPSQAFGLLVERVGSLSNLRSEYIAGDASQGVAVSNDFASLLRSVGPFSNSTSSFVAGDNSQGVVMQATGVVSASLLNVAGDGARSHDHYVGGRHSQGAIASAGDTSLTAEWRASAVFADVAGVGAASNDTYVADDRARGYHKTGSRFSGNVDSGVDDDLGLALFVDAAGVAGASTAAPETVDPQDATIRGGLTASATAWSDDEYRGLVTPGSGFGTRSAFFVDIGGNDVYNPSGLWEFAPSRPSNNALWHRGVESCMLTASTDIGTFPSARMNQTYCGADVGYSDDDGDMVPSFVENLWIAWESHPDDRRGSPSPTGGEILVDLGTRDRVLNEPYAFVLTLNGDDAYLENFSAAVHLDLGGADVYRGRVGAAQSSDALGASTDVVSLGFLNDFIPMPDEVDAALGLDGGNVPFSQHLLSFLVDLSGDDTYDARVGGVQGYGAGGASGILFDLAGSDTYLAPQYAQGAAGAGGIGVLVDGRGGESEVNLFRAGNRSQGHADSSTVDNPAIGSQNVSRGLALLVGFGDHNTFDDGTTMGSTSGASVNLGDNDPPEIHDQTLRVAAPDGTEMGDTLDVGVEYRFSVDVSDPDDDDLEACWSFTYGDDRETTRCEGLRNDGDPLRTEVPFAWNETYQVHTDANDPNQRTSVRYDVRLAIQDAGGKTTSTGNIPYTVRNDPPLLLPPVRGPSDPVVGQQAAFQLPFLPAPDMRNLTVSIDWGDGSTDNLAGDAIDWAEASAGGSVRLPELVPVGDVLKPIIPANPVERMNDGDNETSTTFQHMPGTSPAIHFFVDFEDLRNIGAVLLNATATVPTTFSVEGLHADDRMEPLGRLTVAGGQAPVVLTLPDRPAHTGLFFRQLVDRDATEEVILSVRTVEARGPGGLHTWASSGEVEMNYTVIDAYGGRNATSFTVNVTSDSDAPVSEELTDAQEALGLLPEIPFELQDIMGRGRVRHATVPYAPGGENQQPVRLTLVSRSEDDQPVCINWGDGTPPDCRDEIAIDAPITFNHHYSASDDRLVTATYGQGDSMRGPVSVVQLHVEEAFELVTSDGDPLLFLTLLENRTTWYTQAHGIAPHMAVVDRGGDDRHLGTVAASVPLVDPGVLLRPSLVLDIAGDDNYLSTTPMTQGFAALGGVALLADMGGNDVYVAPGMAQGAAIRGSVSVMMDLGGDDHFNPVPSSHRAVQDAFPTTWSVWMDRPAVLQSPRPALAPSQANLVQGAAMDGVGVLLAHGGVDTFTAGRQAQGYGFHDPQVGNQNDYVFANQTCASPTYLQNPSNGPPIQTPVGPTPPVPQILCAFGIRFTPAQSPTPPFNIIAVNTQELNEFLGPSGPRYGASLGALVHTGGAATYHARLQAQGASDNHARGVLLDGDGAAVAGATREAQAFTRQGLGAFVTGGYHTASLDRMGQATAAATTALPESVGVDLALYAAPDEDHRGCDQDCGSATMTPPPSPQGPGLSWGPGDIDPAGLAVHHGDRFDIVVDVESDDAVEVFASSQVLPQSDAGGGVCIGAPIAPPTTILHTTVPDPVDGLGMTLDLDAELDDGPLHPAGCTRIAVFARGVGSDGEPRTAWSKLTGDAWLLPPPKMELLAAEGDSDGWPLLVTSGPPVPAVLVSHEPYALLPGAPTVPFQFDLRAVNQTSGNTHDVQLQQPAVDALPHGLSIRGDLGAPPDGGVYALEAKTGWNGHEGIWQRIGTLVVDIHPPAVTGSLPDVPIWKGQQTIRLSGQVVDAGTDVDHIDLRLVDNACTGPDEDCLIRLHLPNHLVNAECERGNDKVAGTSDDKPWHKCVIEVVPAGQTPRQQCPPQTCRLETPPSDQGGIVRLPLARETSGVGAPWEWSTAIRSTTAFGGGVFRVQVNAEDLGGRSTGWVEVMDELLIDKRPPRVVSLASTLGTNTTNTTYGPGEPLRFTLHLEDCSIDPARVGGTCRPGSGVQTEELVVFTQDRNQEFTLLEVASSEAVGDGIKAEIHWTWDGRVREDGQPMAGPPAGEYNIQVQASDTAGNVLVLNPGLPFFVDRTPPSLTEASLAIQLPEGQQAVKPGDRLEVSVNAQDVGADRTDIHNVTVTLAGNTVTLAEAEPTRYVGTMDIPDGLLPAGAPDDGHTLEFLIEATDLAGNQDAFHANGGAFGGPVQYFEDSIVSTQQDWTLRAESLSISWRTNRPASIVEATATDLLGNRVEADVHSAGVEHRAEFRGLLDDTEYALTLRVRDAAGFVDEPVEDFLSTFTTPAMAPTDVVLDNLPDTTYSGNVTLSGAVQDAVPGHLTLHVGDLDGPVLAARDIQVPLGSHPTEPFSFKLDSRTHIPASLDGAVEIPVFVRMDDGASAWNRSVTLRFDNAPPAMAPHVLGAQSPDIWHNRSIRVDAGSQDDTNPMFHEVRVGDGGWQAARSVDLTGEGVHNVTFRARDAAHPPNHANASVQVRIDKTPPRLEASVSLPHRATNNTTVPLDIVAVDVGILPSGLQDYRAGVDGSWTPWNGIPATAVLLPDGPDGERWIEVEARDAAGNRNRSIQNILLDRAPPDLLAARWIGPAEDGHLLHVVAQDRLDAVPGRGAGVDAVRIGSGGGDDTIWGLWRPGGGNDALLVNESVDVLVQVRDRAGNIGDPVPVPPPTGATSPPEEAEAPVDRASFTQVSLAPRRGTADGRFVFSAVVAGPDGAQPEQVWLEIDGQRHAMAPTGPPLDDGGRLYSVSLRLAPSMLNDPYDYRVVALLDGDESVSETLPGPVVMAEGTGAVEQPSDDSRRGVPTPGAGPLAAILAAAALLGVLRRRRPGQ